MERQADRVLLSFGGLPPPVELCAAGELLPLVERVFHGWDISRVDTHELAPVLRVSRCAQGYRLDGTWIPSEMFRREEADALCGFVAELLFAYVNETPGPLCLHGAAAEFAGRLVVFPSTYRAGKSLLSACLAAAGVRLFGDDILMVSGSNGHGIAPGLAPRLRQPLPENLGEGARHFIKARRGPSGTRYLYLDLTNEELAQHKATAPIGAIVLLDREDDAVCELTPVGVGEVLKQIIWQNFARRAEVLSILDGLHRIVSRVPAFRLRYGSSEEAAAFLKATFQNWTEESPASSPAQSVRAAVDELEAQDIALGPGQYLRHPAITERLVEGERFLADPVDNAIHHLNPLASAVWTALSEPARMDELVALLLTAFPEAEGEAVARDVEALLTRFVAAGLVLMGPPSPAQRTGTAMQDCRPV